MTRAWIARLAQPGVGLSAREIVDGDREFLRDLYASTRAEELAPVPWPEAEKQQFLTRQFEAQHAHYRENLPDADYLLLEIAGEPAGRIYLDERHDEIRLVDMALLPEHRGAGIGSGLLRTVIEAAVESGRTVRLHVERHNPAWRLYDRFGFVELEDRGVYRFMEWRPRQAERSP
ncbi:GNAT family N-acetyltransferase [Halomonas denitrificans]|nr:GNAT family N-acetyltransferase [Halomonas denitrificans]